MKKSISWPKPKGFQLDDDSGLLIGNRIHQVIGGQVIGQQNIDGDVTNLFGSPEKKPTARKAKRKARKRARRASK